jgi:hypothetical protein
MTKKQLRNRVFAAVVLSFAVGAGAGFVAIAKNQPSEAQLEQQCYTELKASFEQVWAGRPDPIKGKMPEPCTHLSEQTYGQIYNSVIVEVSTQGGAR